MKTKRYYKQLLLATSIVGLGFALAPAAQAAFEWTPPKKVVEQEAAPAATEGDMLPASPVGEVQVEESTPAKDQAPVEYVDEEVAEDLKEIIEEAEENNVITPVAEIPESEQIDKIPENAVVTPAPAEEAAEAEVVEDVAEEIVEAASVMEEVTAPAEEVMNDPNLVQGFGKDLPLIMAVRQIVPANVPYAFGESVDMSKTVSWEGGATWQETMSKIATENELEIAFEDVVRISNVNTALAGSKTPKIETIHLESIQESEDVAAEATEEAVEIVMENADVPVTEMEEQLMPEEAELTMEAEAVEVHTEEMVLMEEPKTENEVLEATISDAIVISPIEDMEPAIAAVAEEGQDAMTEVTEGAVIGPIDQPELPPMELLESTEEEIMVEIPVEEPALEDILEEAAPDMMVEEDVVVLIEEDSMPQPEIEELVETTMDDTMEMMDVEDPAMAAIDNVVEDMKDEVAAPMPLQITEPAPVAVAEMPAQADVANLTEEMVEIAAATNAPAMIAAPSLDMVKTWKVKKNSDLRTTLEEWSEEAGVNLQWNMDHDYSVNYMVWVDGNFEEAVDVLMQGYNNDKGLIPAATLQMDASGPVLIIEPAA